MNTTTSRHQCADCNEPISLGAEVFLGHEGELRAFHQGCFEQPAPVIPEQRTA